MSQTAKDIVQRLSAIKYIPGGHTRSLIDIDEEVAHTPPSPAALIRAGTKYLTASLWQPPLFPEEKARRATDAEAKRIQKERAAAKRLLPPRREPASWLSATEAVHDWAADAMSGWAEPSETSAGLRGRPPQYHELGPRPVPRQVDEEMTDGVESDSGQSAEVQIATPVAEQARGRSYAAAMGPIDTTSVAEFPALPTTSRTGGLSSSTSGPSTGPPAPPRVRGKGKSSNLC